jgi:hypothetical protein
LVTWKLATGLILLFGASGCSVDTLTPLQKEAEKLAHIGMPLAQAAANLRAAGFKCAQNPAPNADPGDLVCKRTRSRFPMGKCVDHVDIAGWSSKKDVGWLAVERPDCSWT